jgi:hypothetical protein
MNRPEIVAAFLETETPVPSHFIRDPTIKLSDAEIRKAAIRVATREFTRAFFRYSSLEHNN